MEKYNDCAFYAKNNGTPLRESSNLADLVSPQCRLFADTLVKREIHIPSRMGEKIMVRLLTVAAFAASLLIWSAQVSANSPFPVNPAATQQHFVPAEADLAACSPAHCTTCPPGQCRFRQRHSGNAGNQNQHKGSGLFSGNGGLGQRLGLGNGTNNNGNNAGQGWSMPNLFRNSGSGQVAAATGQQGGVLSGIGSRPQRTAAVARPVGPPPNSFFEGMLAPQRFQQGTRSMAGAPGLPWTGVPVMMNPGAHAHGMMNPNIPGFPIGHPGEPNNLYDHNGPVRIVYVPYAMPPPITVDRLARALPRPSVRGFLGDARMYEYPQMPHDLYTTRGPRDFLAPNPPCIGF